MKATYSQWMSVTLLTIALGAAGSIGWSAEASPRVILAAAPNNTMIADGLRQALQIGTANAVKSTGRVDGYFKNAAIKILVPRQLQNVEQVLRTVGAGQQVDQFEMSMNRAAEKAAPKALPIFARALRGITFDDARKILTGGDTAATTYFKEKTSAELISEFKPIISQSLDQVGATHQFKSLTSKAQGIPFLSSPSLDLDNYVVGKAMDGLFYVLGQEERKIRRDPVSQVTQVLKQVFGGRF